MKEKILAYLMENTIIENRYIGGGDEPSIIVFKDSDWSDKETYLSEIADELVMLIND